MAIDQEKLERDRELFRSVNKLLLLFQNEDYSLIGGTAINKGYFGKNQRLSYDIDLEVGKRKDIEALLEKNGYKLFVRSKLFTAFDDTNGIRIDVTDKRNVGIPTKVELKGPQYFAGENLSAVVNSLDFEALFARKINALAVRGTAKDLYDAWQGIRLNPDKKKVARYIIKLSALDGIDARIITTPHHYADTDLSKIDAPVLNLDGKAMYDEVKQYLRFLFFKG